MFGSHLDGVLGGGECGEGERRPVEVMEPGEARWPMVIEVGRRSWTSEPCPDVDKLPLLSQGKQT
jgi:hypothetical protein